MEAIVRNLFFVIAFAGSLAIVGAARADGCGPGCHETSQGACVIDGWTTRAAPNECPAGNRPRPPCPRDYAWRYGACFQR